MDHKLALEYREVGLRQEHLDGSGLSYGEVLDLIESLEGVAEAVQIIRQPRPISTDPNDDMVFDLAINGNADAIVTSNARHFAAAGKRFGITVLSPAELLRSRRKWNEAAN